jgi:hypothetical protein
MSSQTPENVPENASSEGPIGTANKPKKREEWDKKGKYKYLKDLIQQVRQEQKDIKIVLRYMAKGLETQMVFEAEYIQDLACRDEVDAAILTELRYAGEYGVLPRDVAARLGDKRFTRFFVSRRLKQMNKRLDAILGQRVAEKRGKAWALTSFMRSAWDSTREELEADVMKNE